MLRFLKVSVLGSLALAASAYAVGLIPTPVLKTAQISADVAFDSVSGYSYTYTVTNPSGNTGEIRNFRIDVTGGGAMVARRALRDRQRTSVRRVLFRAQQHGRHLRGQSFRRRAARSGPRPRPHR